jgi:hypothetical protein
MYPVFFGSGPPSQHSQQFVKSNYDSFRAQNTPSFFNQEQQQQYHNQNPYHGYQQNYPVQQSNNNTTVIVINQPICYPSSSMQLPQASHHHNLPQIGAPVPAHYNSYFSTTPHSRPIQINTPSGRYIDASYNDRIMGLDFGQPSNSAVNTSNNLTNVDSVYLMDFMDDENPPASSSNNLTSSNLPINSIEDALRRANVTAAPVEEDKENESARPASPSPRKEGTFSTPRIMNVYGAPGMRSFKRRTLYDDDLLIHEETESEAGFSGDDDCISNCGCVHSCIGSPIDFDAAPSVVTENNNNDIPFTRLGFRSIGDIIGYAQVVRAERLEALAELRNAVDKFNDMRQRNQSLRSKYTTN